MGELARWFIAANPAAAVEMGAGFNHQLADRDFARDPSGGHDLQALGFDRTLKAATDQHPLGLDPALHVPGLADDDLGPGFDVTLDATVDVQVVL